MSLPPGTLVRISVWVRVPKALTGSVDGALIYDTPVANRWRCG